MLAQLAVEVLPVVATDTIIRLELLLAISPLAQTLQMDILHGAGAFAWRDERVATTKVFFVFEADSAALARLIGDGMLSNLSIQSPIEWASQPRAVATLTIVQAKVNWVRHASVADLAAASKLCLCIPPIRL